MTTMATAKTSAVEIVDAQTLISNVLSMREHVIETKPESATQPCTNDTPHDGKVELNTVDKCSTNANMDATKATTNITDTTTTATKPASASVVGESRGSSFATPMEEDDMEAVHFLLAFSAVVKSEPSEEPMDVVTDDTATQPPPLVIAPTANKRAASQRARKPTSKVRQNNNSSPSTTSTTANTTPFKSSDDTVSTTAGSTKRPHSEVNNVGLDTTTPTDVVLPSPPQPTQPHKTKRSRTTAASKQQQQQQQRQQQQQQIKSDPLAVEVVKHQHEWRTCVADVLSDFRLLLQRTMTAENGVYEHVQYTRQDIHATLARSMMTATDAVRKSLRDDNAMTKKKITLRPTLPVMRVKKRKRSEFHQACITGNLKQAQQLFQRDAVDLLSADLLTPLYLAVKNDRFSVATFLLQSQADPNLRCGAHQLTPLHEAAKQNNAMMAKLLIENGADRDARSPIDDGQTPAEYPISIKFWSVLQNTPSPTTNVNVVAPSASSDNDNNDGNDNDNTTHKRDSKPDTSKAEQATSTTPNPQTQTMPPTQPQPQPQTQPHTKSQTQSQTKSRSQSQAQLQASENKRENKRNSKHEGDNRESKRAAYTPESTDTTVTSAKQTNVVDSKQQRQLFAGAQSLSPIGKTKPNPHTTATTAATTTATPTPSSSSTTTTATAIATSKTDSIATSVGVTSTPTSTPTPPKTSTFTASLSLSSSSSTSRTPTPTHNATAITTTPLTSTNPTTLPTKTATPTTATSTPPTTSSTTIAPTRTTPPTTTTLTTTKPSPSPTPTTTTIAITKPATSKPRRRQSSRGVRPSPKLLPMDITTEFFLGKDANEALLLLGRGRLWGKHKDLFRYSCSKQEKQALIETGNMPQTIGPKITLVCAEQIRQLVVENPHYNPNTTIKDNVAALAAFPVTQPILDKIQEMVHATSVSVSQLQVKLN